MTLSPRVVSAGSEHWGPVVLKGTCVCVHIAGVVLELRTCPLSRHAWEKGEDMSRIAKRIMVKNAFIPATFSLKYCEITYYLCTVCLFPWTALALVKLLKVPELQHSCQGWLADMGWWLLVHHYPCLTRREFFKSIWLGWDKWMDFCANQILQINNGHLLLLGSS